MEFRVPELGEGVYEAELVAWLVKPGDAVKRGQHLMEVITDKASFEVPAPFAGVITSLAAQPGQQIKVGDPILTYSTGQAEAEAPAPAEPTESPPPTVEQRPAPVTTRNSPQPVRHKVEEKKPSAAKANGRHSVQSSAARAAPSVRQMAQELGIDLADVRGSGPAGRILIADLAQYVQPQRGAAAARGEQPAEYGTPGTRMKFVGLRRKIAEHMVQAKHTIPHYTYVDECDVTNLVRLRETYRQAGVRMTYLPFFVKAVVAALKQVPIANASLDESAGEIVLHDRYDIGIATSTPKGLVVPVVRNADRKSLLELATEIERLASAARAGQSSREDLQGGTFTITSIGSIGGLISTPIINHPEVGIIGIGKIVKRPLYDESGSLRAAEIAYLSFSFDHRVLDGAVGAAFGNAVIASLQDAALWLELLSSGRDK